MNRAPIFEIDMKPYELVNSRYSVMYSENSTKNTSAYRKCGCASIMAGYHSCTCFIRSIGVSGYGEIVGITY